MSEQADCDAAVWFVSEAAGHRSRVGNRRRAPYFGKGGRFGSLCPAVTFAQ
jgi:hypothetical protein